MGERKKIKNGLTIDESGNKRWYKNYLLHRDDDLPAIIWDNERANSWYQYGKRHRENDLPAIIDSDGNKLWYKNGKLHRDNDKPAIEYTNGYKVWCYNGLSHRDNELPAVINPDGTVEYWENGERLTQEDINYRNEMKKLNQELYKDLSNPLIKNNIKKI